MTKKKTTELRRLKGINKTGRPEEHDRDELAIKLLNWSLKENSTNLNQFCSEECIAPSQIFRFKESSDAFCKAYELTKSRIAAKREKNLNEGTLHVKCYDMNASVYDAFLRDERRAQAEFEASLNKAKVDIPPLDNIIELQNELMRLKAENQALKSKIDAV